MSRFFDCLDSFWIIKVLVKLVLIGTALYELFDGKRLFVTYLSTNSFNNHFVTNHSLVIFVMNDHSRSLRYILLNVRIPLPSYQQAKITGTFSPRQPHTTFASWLIQR